ncbi:MAG TPA: ABC1 kinase family protein, partial [Candidatus Hypogeohydataceae bacterium YC38]
DLARTPRRLQRLSQILQTLVRHGFGHMVYGLRLHEYLPVGRRFLEKHVPVEEQPLAARIVQMFQELGPLYIKLGQMLSTRPDIIPEDFIREFQKLQKDVRPFDPKVSRAIIEEELKSPISSLFSSFQDEPIACGSIAQVHAATFRESKEVVVKVKRPGIDRIIWSDLDLLALIAERAERIAELAVFHPTMLIEEFYRVIQNELDFVTEASNTSKFHRLYQDNPRVRIPKVYWDLSTSNVLTLERIKDTSLVDLEVLEKKGIDKKKLAMELLGDFMEQYFKAGVFHADPHPGNLMVSDSGTLSMIDFGMVGYITEELKGQLSTSLFALLRKDIDLFIEVFMDIGAIPTDGRLETLKSSLHGTIEKFMGIPMKRIDPRRAFFDTMKIARDHHLVLPRDFVLLGKSFVTVTSIAKELDPDLNLLAVITPVARSLMRDRFSPEHLGKLAREGSWHLANLVSQGPREMRQILKKLLSGRIEVALRHVELESFAYELDRASNRLALSIILAATVIASSLVMMARIGPMVMENISLLGILGYLFATVMGIWLIIGIFRSGRL